MGVLRIENHLETPDPYYWAQRIIELDSYVIAKPTGPYHRPLYLGQIAVSDEEAWQLISERYLKGTKIA